VAVRVGEVGGFEGMAGFGGFGGGGGDWGGLDLPGRRFGGEGVKVENGSGPMSEGTEVREESEERSSSMLTPLMMRGSG
jgi:hypothetical protein